MKFVIPDRIQKYIYSVNYLIDKGLKANQIRRKLSQSKIGTRRSIPTVSVNKKWKIKVIIKFLFALLHLKEINKYQKWCSKIKLERVKVYKISDAIKEYIRV